MLHRRRVCAGGMEGMVVTHMERCSVTQRVIQGKGSHIHGGLYIVLHRGRVCAGG